MIMILYWLPERATYGAHVDVDIRTERIEPAEPFDRHRGLTDVSHFLPLNRTPLFRKKILKTDRTPFREWLPYESIPSQNAFQMRLHRSWIPYSTLKYYSREIEIEKMFKVYSTKTASVEI